MASRKEYETLFKLNAELGGAYNSSFAKAGGPVVDLQNKIQQLNKTQNDISSYTKQQGAAEATRKKLENLKTQYDNIQQEMRETGNESSAMKNKLIDKQNQIDKTSNSLKGQTDKLDQMGKSLRDAGVDTDNLAGASTKLSGNIEILKAKQEEVAEASDEMGNAGAQGVQAIGQALVAAGLVVAFKAVADAMKECVDEAIAFESAMAGVAKTSDLSERQLADIADTFMDLSRTTPVTAIEFANIAEVAGQLGIAEDRLVSFSKTMADLQTSTTMTAEEAAMMSAQFANITQMDPSQYENMASAIVDLGNNFATTEQKVLNMSQGIAASGSIVGMSEADILGISTAISSVGIEAQAGATSISRVIQELDKAVKTEKDLKEFARVANMTGDQFKRAWEEDAAGALAVFVEGLNDAERNGKSAIEVLEDLGITEIRSQRTLLSLAETNGLMTEAINTSNTAWSENTALAEETRKRYETTESQVTMAKNAFTSLKTELGEAFLPVVQDVAAVTGDMFTGLAEFVENNPELVRAIGLAAGAFTAFAGGLILYSAAKAALQAASAVLLGSVPGLGTMLAVAAGVSIAAGAIYLLSQNTGNAGVSFEELDEQFATHMQVIQDTQALQDLYAEYESLSGQISGTGESVETYQAKQQALWESYKSGEIPWTDYQLQLATLREDYILSQGAVGEYMTKEDDLWKRYKEGEIPLGIYRKEIDLLNQEYGDLGGSIDTYKDSESKLWTAYTDGKISVDEYIDKLEALRTEHGFGVLSAGDLAAQQERLSIVKQALRDQSGGLITATDEETAAFDRQAAALNAITEAKEYEARQQAYENIVKQSAAYAAALKTETENQVKYNETAAEREKVETAVGGGILETQQKLRDIAAELANQDPAWYLDPNNAAYMREQLDEAERLYNTISGGTITFPRLGDLENQLPLMEFDINATNAEEAIQGLIRDMALYGDNIQESETVQQAFLDNLVLGVNAGGMEVEHLRGLLMGEFGDMEGGAEIVADAMQYVEEHIKATGQAATDAAGGTDDLANSALTLEDAWQQTIDKAKKLEEAYTASYTAAYTSISGQMGLFEEMKVETKLSVDAMTKSLENQAQYMGSYAENLKTAAALGVSDGLIKELSDGSVESAGYLQTIVNSGEGKIAELNTAFAKVSEGKETFATTVAELETDFTATMTSLQTELTTTIAAMNLNAEAAESGRSTIQGFIDGANSQLTPVKTAFAALAKAAANEMKVRLDIESPSKVTHQIGEFTGQGFIGGVEKMTPYAAQSMREMAQAGLEAFGDENIVSLLGSNAYARGGKVYVETGRSSAPVSVQVSPVYNITGYDNPEQIRGAIAGQNNNLTEMVLNILENRDIDVQRRQYGD